MGISRYRNGGFDARIQGREVRNGAELARHLPVQLINAASFNLLEAGPRARRQFLDWGVFHVEPTFHRAWIDVSRSLRQRNALLRHGKISPELSAWDMRLAEGGAELDRFRHAYFERLCPVFRQTLADLVELEEMDLSYYRGWDRARELTEVLRDQLTRDRERGHTLNGPHRADLRLRIRGRHAEEVLSRGQQKLVVCALKLAQARLYMSTSDQNCVFVVDDLPSELDRHHRTKLCQLLGRMGCQVMVSSVEADELKEAWSLLPTEAIKLFHVERGSVRAGN